MYLPTKEENDKQNLYVSNKQKHKLLLNLIDFKFITANTVLVWFYNLEFKVFDINSIC